MKKNLLLTCFSLLIACVLAEGLLRLVGFNYPNFYRYDLYTGAALRHGAEGWWQEEGRSYVRINGQGMRDDREIQIQKPDNVFRIAVLGDSYAEALQVDVAKTFWRILENRLLQCGYGGGKRIEVLNFGVSGYSTAQELITLKTRVAKFKPDLVLLAFLSGNDVRDNSREIAGPYPRPYFTLDNGRLIEDTSFREHWIFRLKSSLPWQWFQSASDYSRLIQLVNKVKNVAGQPLSAPRSEGGVEEIGLDDHIYLSIPPPVWEQAWQLTEALVAEVQREAARQRASFLLVTLTNPGQVPPDSEAMRRHAIKLGEKDLFYPERRMRALVAREGIDAVFLAELFARYAEEHKVFLHGFPNTQMGGGHWNETGHALAADLIAKHLCAKGN
jgi:lysophospholipase L1-like esterase